MDLVLRSEDLQALDFVHLQQEHGGPPHVDVERNGDSNVCAGISGDPLEAAANGGHVSEQVVGRHEGEDEHQKFIRKLVQSETCSLGAGETSGGPIRKDKSYYLFRKRSLFFNLDQNWLGRGGGGGFSCLID